MNWQVFISLLLFLTVLPASLNGAGRVLPADAPTCCCGGDSENPSHSGCPDNDCDMGGVCCVRPLAPFIATVWQSEAPAILAPVPQEIPTFSRTASARHEKPLVPPPKYQSRFHVGPECFN